MLLAAEAANGHGMGIGWVAKRNMVCWEKGLTRERLHELVATVRLPMVIHFRIASVGGIQPDLCHPFPVTAEAQALKGKARGATLVFHNGHWGAWKDYLLRSLTADGHSQLPPGAWSDSRAMALLAHRHGRDVLKLIAETQRIVALDSHGAQRYGSGWSLEQGIWFSNLHGMRAALGIPEQPRFRAFENSACGPQRGTTWGGTPLYTWGLSSSLDAAVDDGLQVEVLDEDALPADYCLRCDAGDQTEPCTCEPEDTGEAEAVAAVAQGRVSRRNR